jgi:hypothetical protein
MNQKIRNRGDWFMVGMLVRYECPNQKRGWHPKDGTTWLNHVLIQAPSPATAYEKAMTSGRTDSRSTNASRLWYGKWRFLGLAELIPVDGDITDGVELLWSDFGKTSHRRATSFVRPKAELLRQVQKDLDSNHTSDRIAHPQRVRKRSR